MKKCKLSGRIICAFAGFIPLKNKETGSTTHFPGGSAEPAGDGGSPEH